MPKKNVDLSGQRFGRLLAVERLRKNERREWIWRFQCDCGNVLETYASRVLSGGTQSCGCLHKEVASALLKTHGQSLNGAKYRREWILWKHIKQRCNNPNDEEYKNYGARGVGLWPEWNTSFENFIQGVTAEIGERPSPRHQIDRINNGGNYEPGNIRWVLPVKNIRNRRSTLFVTYAGEKVVLGALCERFRVNYMSVYERIFTYGATPEQAIIAALLDQRLDYKGRMHIATIDGLTGSLGWLARRLGLVYQTLYHHVVREGMLAQEAADFMRRKSQRK